MAKKRPKPRPKTKWDRFHAAHTAQIAHSCTAAALMYCAGGVDRPTPSTVKALGANWMSVLKKCFAAYEDTYSRDWRAVGLRLWPRGYHVQGCSGTDPLDAFNNWAKEREPGAVLGGGLEVIRKHVRDLENLLIAVRGRAADATDQEKQDGQRAERHYSAEPPPVPAPPDGAVWTQPEIDILRALKGKLLSTCDLAAAVHKSESAVKKHLPKLKTAHAIKASGKGYIRPDAPPWGPAE